MNPKVFPTILIVLMGASSIVYAFDGDWRKSVYWLAGAILNVCVTY